MATSELQLLLRSVPLLALLVSGACAGASAPVRSNAVSTPPATPALDTRLDDLRRQHALPGAALALITAQTIDAIYLGAGAVDGRNPVGASTVFQAASLGKPLFAQAVLARARRGALDLDAPLKDSLDGPYLHQEKPWKAAGQSPVREVGPETLGAISARMVLQHATGLPNWARAEPLVPGFTPGAEFSYSGEGYVLLQRVLEQRTGEPLEALMRREVLAPLGMSASSFVRPDGAALAAGHNRAGLPKEQELWPQPLASSSLFTTLPDYARFVRALLAGEAPVPLAAMLERPISVDPQLGLSFGLGLAIEQIAEHTFFFHWGANPGFTAFFLGSTERGRAILVLTNGESGLDFANDAVELLWHERHPLFSYRLLRPN